jgi:2-polyprenyl-3-methyl-5-hydroxy-6-metoxy-1,4-benzoquinol methylase
MENKIHWEKVYAAKPATSVSWYQEHAECSLALLNNTGITKSAAIIDVGGGASTLVDDLLAEGYSDVTVLDLSASALSAAKKRLGALAVKVQWLEADVTEADLPSHRYDVWHDRAVFHFLTEPQQRQAYVEKVFHSVKPGGHVIVATFAEDGPTQCSGLPVMRYSADELHAQFGESFTLVKHVIEAHHTPSGGVQHFVYCYCRVVAS